MKSSKLFIIVSDANVLIDFLITNEEILMTACTTIFDIYVPVPILREIKQLSEAKAKKLGLKLFEPTIEQLSQSVSTNPRLSFEDSLCLQIAKENGWICTTNDKALRKECDKLNVNKMWGLEIMLILNQEGHLSRRDALKVAEKICEINLRITKEVVENFNKKLK
jgi:rRNA-processing protein FCF1